MAKPCAIERQPRAHSAEVPKSPVGNTLPTDPGGGAHGVLASEICTI